VAAMYVNDSSLQQHTLIADIQFFSERPASSWGGLVETYDFAVFFHCYMFTIFRIKVDTVVHYHDSDTLFLISADTKKGNFE